MLDWSVKLHCNIWNYLVKEKYKSGIFWTEACVLWLCFVVQTQCLEVSLTMWHSWEQPSLKSRFLNDQILHRLPPKPIHLRPYCSSWHEGKTNAIKWCMILSKTLWNWFICSGELACPRWLILTNQFLSVYYLFAGSIATTCFAILLARFCSPFG